MPKRGTFSKLDIANDCCVGSDPISIKQARILGITDGDTPKTGYRVVFVARCALIGNASSIDLLADPAQDWSHFVGHVFKFIK